ncbi:Ribosomal protein S20 [Acididesulfobacillus acetoxydans]|uniref:Flagellar hook-associated protein 1 n=1 Tax=Acididesulfobacillus acetoxydans TaxID=1561005 RepID=A0A8S0W5I5_9FIRM|nr:flagellar hook-associated protein FlgK [Acididesulfobacillus acetoxydans]CAA7603178.1 Ribosomal protein S20 [Acididesulfobacillus acetoxydans]CEJ07594.1 Flagellar hook-associated protein FlgK [Acididesulfobacillus acetoxydans]
MPSTFFGLQIAANALAAQQAAVDVTGHNIANASNAAYTRELPNFVAATPYTFPSAGHYLTLGEGVNIGSVTRARDAFVDAQYRNQNSLLSYWTQQQDGLNKIQGIMNEPSDSSLASTLNTFWSDWSTLANNAQNSAARTTVQQQSVTLAEMFNQMSSQISALQTSYESAVSTGVAQVNSIAEQVSQLNVQINKAEAGGSNPNDLLDRRDALVDQLSQYYQVSVVQTQQGAVTHYEVQIGGKDLVNGANYNTLAFNPAANADVNWTGGKPVLAQDVSWASVTTPGGPAQPAVNAAVGSGDGSGGDTGSIKGNLDNLTKLAGLQKKYDDMAQGIADAVNQLQNQGIDMYGQAGGSGQSFFTYNTAASSQYSSQGAAASLQVNGSILHDPNKIAAADPSGGEITAGTASLQVGTTAYSVNVTAGETLASVLNALQKQVPGAFTYTISGNQVTINNTTDTTTPPSPQSISFGTGDTSNLWQIAGLQTVPPAPPASSVAPGHSAAGTITVAPSDIQSNGANAQSIADLQNSWSPLQFAGNTPVLPGGAAANSGNPVFAAVSVSDYYGALVSGIGVDGQQANNMETNQQTLVNSLSNQRQSVSGVSLDQEMTNMITYQKSYTAAARVVTMMDDMLNTLVTGMGITR